MQKWYYFAMLHKFQDIPHQKALNVDSATDEIPWNDPRDKQKQSKASAVVCFRRVVERKGNERKGALIGDTIN